MSRNEPEPSAIRPEEVVGQRNQPGQERKDRGLSAIGGDSRGLVDVLEFGGDEHFPILAARHLTVFVGHESTDELDVSRHDADLKVGFESDFGHIKKMNR